MKEQKLKQDNNVDDDQIQRRKKNEIEEDDTVSYSTDTENTSDTESINKNSPRSLSSGDMTRKNNIGVTRSTGNSSDDSGMDNIGVRFAMNAIERHEVESHVDFSDKERSKYWWSDREKDRMMAKHERLVAKYEQRKQTKPSSKNNKKVTKTLQSYRGLESWTVAGSLKLDYAIEQCISAVMDEQDKQWNENDDDSIKIAKSSLKVTEDSARRARLNGLQDAQEALRVRGESWIINCNDDMSVGSVASYGTAAIAKKKKRSKLLARLDDSYNGRNANKEDVLSSLKNSSTSSKKITKKKKNKKKATNEGSTKLKKKKKSKSKNNKKSSLNYADTDGGDDTTTNDDKAKKSRTAQQIDNNTGVKVQAKGEETFEKDHFVVSERDQINISTNATSVVDTTNDAVSAPPTRLPSSPLSTFLGKEGKQDVVESPLLATLRRQQQMLRQEALNIQMPMPIEHAIKNYGKEDDVSPLVQTLRRQQQKQANDHHNETSDPPGRRPRRLVSRHAERHTIPENHVISSNTENNKEKLDSTSRPITISERNLSTSSSSFTIDSSGGSRKNGGVGIQNNFRGLRNGATNFFKAGKGSTTNKKKAISATKSSR